MLRALAVFPFITPLVDKDHGYGVVVDGYTGPDGRIFPMHCRHWPPGLS